MSSTLIRIVATVAMASFGVAPGAQAFRQSGTYTPQVMGSGENQSAVPPSGVMGSVQPRAIITGAGENLSVQHLDVPPPASPDYVARITGSGENLSVVHVPSGG
ncbi:hypothetical protein GXW78_11070 [Roseomonas terrae]|jgi:hypothetical protein|uniref:Uncharacterized protein n=1 Tax=Neoroseomonas terrae TaxID=424799 RepID=A0ABS5EGQ5_9PROT|nr:hypothetical protein [Neoroseomonas terrae]MBR0650205.1 hypothetical protein [Neoroseomonas terrae]